MIEVHDGILDIVNEKNEVIDQKGFFEVHEKGLLHRTSDVFVFKDSTFQELLITKRSEKIKAPGKLCNPGGHANQGETHIETAKKELQEEVFHEHKLPKEISLEKMFLKEVTFGDEHCLLSLYRTIYPGPFYNDPEEVSEIFFMNIDELQKDIIENPDKYTNFFVWILKEYLKIVHSNI